MQARLLQPQDITERLKTLDIQPLVQDNFETFAANVGKLFFKDARVQEFYSPGRNSLSVQTFDFSKGKPSWRISQPPYDQPETVELVSRRGTTGHEWMYVQGRPSLHLVCGYGAVDKGKARLPVRFAFDGITGLYIAEHEGNGTEDCPFENYFLRV
ncbi:MAG: hypothetical protein Q7R96_04835 [Nanoarchaeota archaeon]|nr:hypothetical protein [Nanoarchaeota archaeon]